MLADHVGFATSPPEITWKLERVFRLLDRMEVYERDVILEGVYLHFRMSFEELGENPQERMQIRYKAFEQVYRMGLAWCRDEEFLVSSLISAVLAQGHYRSGLQSLGRVVQMQCDHLADLRAEPVTDDSSASYVFKGIQTTQDALNSLHEELEERYSAYQSFCKVVVEPLLADR